MDGTVTFSVAAGEKNGTPALADLDPDELVFGLSRWADGELRERRLTPAQHDEVLALIDGAEVTR